MPTVFQRIFKKLSDLLDVAVTAPSDGQVLKYSASSGTWQNANAAETDVTNLANDLAGKADKVSGATNGHLASLTAAGDLADSGHLASDFLASTYAALQSITVVGMATFSASSGNTNIDFVSGNDVNVTYDPVTKTVTWATTYAETIARLSSDIGGKVSDGDNVNFDSVTTDALNSATNVWAISVVGGNLQIAANNHFVLSSGEGYFDFSGGTLYNADGSQLINLNAGNINSGTLDDTHINSNSRYRMGHVSGRYYMWHGVTGVSGSNTLTANRLYAAPFFVNRTTTFTKIGCETTGAGGSSDTARLGIYSNNNGTPGALVLDAGTVSTTNIGTKEIVISKSLATGWYWLVLTSSSTATFRGSGANNSPSFADLTGWIAQNQQTSILFQDAVPPASALPATLTAVSLATTTMPTIWLRC